MSNADYTFTRTATKLRLARILKLLEESPKGLSAAQLATSTGVEVRTMRTYLKALRGELAGFERQIRVRKWKRSVLIGGMYEAIFVLGHGKDARKPRAMTNTQRVVRYRKRLKAERPEVREQQLAKLRANYALQRPAQRDHLVAAFFGSAGAAA